MMNLIAVLAAATAAPSVAAPHSEALEHRGATYEVVYLPQVTRAERTITTLTARGQKLQWCRTMTRIAVDGEVRLADGTIALRQRLDGERRIASRFVGGCDQNRAAIAAAAERSTLAIRGHVRDLAAAGRPALIAGVDAARAFATN